ncbi:MAG: hypothetical protein IMW98_04495 [Firmicutes bacterium]|nr:hypothetical protein [Bacillota bacterium]
MAWSSYFEGCAITVRGKGPPALATRAEWPREAAAKDLMTLSAYHIATCYPEDRDELQAETTEEVVQRFLSLAEEVLQWASERLRLSGS